MLAGSFLTLFLVPVTVLQNHFRKAVANMITLFSDDSYFSLGTVACLSLLGYDIHVIDPVKTVVTEDDLCFLNNEITLISVSDTLAAEQIILTTYKHRLNCIYFIDAAAGQYNHLMWAHGIVPKNIALHYLPRIIKTLRVREISWFKGLTAREMEVMNSLLEGKNKKLISREMEISEITVSAHKKNALQKLGLTKLNARSIAIYGQFRTVLRYRLSD